MTTGALGDRIGHRKVVLTRPPIAGFGRAITAIAAPTEILMRDRAATGIRGAAAFGLSFALIREAAPNSILKLVASPLAGQAAAVLTLGVLVGFGWRYRYLALPAVANSLVGLIYGLSNAGNACWTSFTVLVSVVIGAIAMGVVALAGGSSPYWIFGLGLVIGGFSRMLTETVAGAFFVGRHPRRPRRCHRGEQVSD